MDLIVQQGLRRALARIDAASTVVVSDRYPPEAYGGAEVSLHILLRSLKLDSELVVVTFSDNTVLPSLRLTDGIRVLELPRQAGWPRHSRLQSLTGKGFGLRSPPRALKEGPPSDVGRATDAELLWQAVRARPRGGVVADFVEFKEGMAVGLLSSVLRALRPSLVHADNHRSILLLAACAGIRGMARVGLVRDNRFHCARYDQSLIVGRKHCVECSFQCAPIDAPDASTVQREMLRRVSAHRIEALRSLHRVIVTSQYLYDSLLPFVGNHQMDRVENAADNVTEVDASAAGIAERPGTNLLVVGMINENKGQLELLRYLELLVSRIPDVVLHFAGRGARIERRLRLLAEEMRLGRRLVFHGHLERAKLYALYRASQIVALPTLWPEPFGRVPLEAALANRPVIAFAVGGLKESILDGRTGILVPPGDMRAFIEALVRLANDPSLGRRMGAAAREHVLNTYTVEGSRDRLLESWSRAKEVLNG